MSLDLTDTATQIDRMAVDLKARRGQRERRLLSAMRALEDFSLDSYNREWERRREALPFPVPVVTKAPGSRFGPPALPSDFCVAAVDGSHIDVDRHLPVRCFLINTGVAVLTYGSSPDADLFSQPRLYATQDELVIKDPLTPREQAIEGAVLGAKRTVGEIRRLVSVAGNLPPRTPTLALLDGSLLMLGLVGNHYQEFVMRELVEDGFAEALEDLREMAKARPLAVASYVSLPRSTEVVNALRLTVCSYKTPDAGYHCGVSGTGRQPCDQCVGTVLDREMYARLLEPGERSAVFGTSSRGVETYYRGNGISFFYVNVGEEIGRVEVPSWIADDEAALGLTHSLVVDQCRRGRGYPVGLMEAHEQAVVGGADRRYFVQAVEEALQGQGMPVYSSEKSRSKRLRWL